MKTFSHLWKYLAEFFLGWEMLQIEVVEKIKIHVLCSVAFFRESCRLWDIVETFGGTRGHKWRHNMAHTRCMLDKQDCTQARACTLPHTHTHTQKYNTYCFFTATIIRASGSVLRYTYIACLVLFFFHFPGSEVSNNSSDVMSLVPCQVLSRIISVCRNCVVRYYKIMTGGVNGFAWWQKNNQSNR